MTSRFQYKHIVAAVFVLGLFMDLLDTTITNVALPTLSREFHASTTSVEWVVTGYLLSLAVFIPVSGWAGDRFGTKRTFLFALTLFVSASALCGAAWSTESIIAFRVLQGVGGGMLTPVGMTMVLRAFPLEERALVTSILITPAVLGPATGTIVGGYLVEYQTWRWIFFVNLPIGLIAIAVAALFLREQRQDETGALDFPGFVLSAGGLASLVYALSQAGPRGFDDSRVISFGLAGLIALAVFVAVELRTVRPLIDVRLFRDRLFSITNALQFLSQARFQGGLFTFTLFLQAERGLSPLESGLTTVPIALGVVTMLPVAGRAYRLLGPRRLLLIGMAFATLTSLALVLVDLESSRWLVRAILLAWGWSLALSIVPLQTAAFATMRPTEMGRASAAYNSIRQVGGSFGVALLATVLSARLTFHAAALGNPATREGAVSAFHQTFVALAALTIVGGLLALLVNDRLAAATYRSVAVPTAKLSAELALEEVSAN